MANALSFGDNLAFFTGLLEVSRGECGVDGIGVRARRFLSLTLAASGFGEGCVYLVDADARLLRPVAWQNAGGTSPATLPLDSPAPAALVAATGKAVFHRSGATHRDAETAAAECYTLVALPLLARGHVVGVLSLASEEPVCFGGEGLSMLELAANQLAVTIESVRLHAESRAERAKVRAIVDACADGILVVDDKQRILDANPALERITGLRPEELFGHSCLYMLGAHDGEGAPVCDAYCPVRARSRAPSGEVEARIQSPSGKEVWVGITFGLLRDGDGQVSGVVHTIRDITAHKAAQRTIVESGRRAEADRRRLQAIVDNLPEGVCIVDQERASIVMANHKAEELLGDPACLLRCTDASRPADLRDANGDPFPESELPLARSLRGEVCTGVQLEVSRRDGRRATLLVNSAPLDDGAGISGAVAIFQDISHIKEVERMKDSFIAAASHELRTPITSIRGYAQLLLRRLGAEAPPGVAKPAEVILRQIDRLVWLINQLLDASRAQKGELEVVLDACDLRDISAEVVERKRLLSERHTIRLHAETPVPVMADGARIEQVLTNLLTNAIEYSPEGGRIDVHVRREQDRALVSVTDEGIGIAPERLNGIFERFYCAHDDLPRCNGGLGLGLYVSHQVVIRHGGTMWVESAVGTGSTFYFALPAPSLPLTEHLADSLGLA